MCTIMDQSSSAFDFAASFTRLLRDYPDATTNRKKFVALLKDFFPGQKKETNLLSSLYDLQIVAEIKSAAKLDRSFVHRFEKRLRDDYGIDQHDAAWAVATWCGCYGKAIIGKHCDFAGGSSGSSTGEKTPDSNETPARAVVAGNKKNYAEIISTFLGNTPPVYKVCFITGLILIGTLWIYMINNNRNNMGLAMLSCLAPVIAVSEFHTWAGIGGLVLNGVAVAHTISLIWILILFFTDRPSDRPPIVFVDWVWVFCTGIIAVVLLWVLLKDNSKKDDRRHR